MYRGCTELPRIDLSVRRTPLGGEASDEHPLLLPPGQVGVRPGRRAGGPDAAVPSGVRVIDLLGGWAPSIVGDGARRGATDGFTAWCGGEQVGGVLQRGFAHRPHSRDAAPARREPTPVCRRRSKIGCGGVVDGRGSSLPACRPACTIVALQSNTCSVHPGAVLGGSPPRRSPCS